MNIWKKILGISLAVSLSVGMSIAPVYADTISILDEITDEETTEDFAEDTSTILARSSYLNLGNVKIQKISSNEIAIKNSIFRNSLIFQGLPPIKYQNLMYFPLFLPL